MCRRPESVAGKMINLPNNICVCNDCMQKSFDIMNSGQIDYSQLMNIPGMQFINLADVEQTVPKQQKIKKKKEKEESLRAAITAGTEQPNPMRRGTIQRPDSPSHLMGLSSAAAVRSI